MRSDMAKVVTERPRRKDHRVLSSSLKTGGLIKVEEFPRSNDGDDDRWKNDNPFRHPISRFRQFGSDAKSFSDLIGPLRRCLRKQVGRPWNDVYSDLSSVLDRRGISGQHIWTHVFSEVELHAVIKYGRIFQQLRTGFYIPVTGLYVHPTTGLLLWSPYHRTKYKAKPDPNLTKLDDLRELVRLEGIWYLRTFHVVKTRILSYSRCQRCASTSTLAREYLHSPTNHKLFAGHEWLGRILEKLREERKLLSKRQLNRKDLLMHGKTNIPPVAPPPSRRKQRRLTLS